MDIPIAKIIRLVTGALLVAGAAWAQIPDYNHSIHPRGISLVGFDGSGAPDPRGNAYFSIRDATDNPLPGWLVTLDLSACPYVRLCEFPRRPGIAVNCALKTVSGETDALGEVRFSVVGSADPSTYSLFDNFPEPDPVRPVPGVQYYFGSCQVTLANAAMGVPPFPFGKLIVSAYDHEVGNPGVGAGDLSLGIADILSGNYRERSDYDVSVAAGGAGALNAGDLAQMVATALAGGSAMSCGVAGPSSPCP